MINRRKFLAAAGRTAGLVIAKPIWGTAPKVAQLTHKERVDRALRGEDVDHPPFTFYHHYKRPTPQLEAEDHLEFHRTYKTDIVKVMNDFDYPKSTTGKWYELKPLVTPFPDQLTTLKLVRDGLGGDAYFIDTIYGPYMTAMILFQSQPQFSGKTDSDELQAEVIREIRSFQQTHPEEWHTALNAITESTLNHIRQIQEIGASGALVSVFNSESRFGTVEEYRRYSRAYHRRVVDALRETKLTFLHLHYLDRAFLPEFADFPAPVLQYSVKTSGIPITEFRHHYSQTFAGGVDEIDYQKLTPPDIRRQWTAARAEAGSKYIAAPGCSVPNSSTAEELERFPHSLGI
ncbi:hypothetical protein DYQ86_24900 [Acidobacteria bacterium AB60]|nr:hypothetical protein DYQ86_24900 [Acidobacteria bacterium AB60]